MIVRGRHYRNAEVRDFHIKDGFITAITPSSKEKWDIGGEDFWVAPGLVDIQVNGYLGHDFCAGTVTPEDVIAVAEKLPSAGVTAFCPTVTTNSHQAMKASLEAISTAIEKSQVARRRILKIHLEGPYISPLDGPRGAHPSSYVRSPDWDEFMEFQTAAKGKIGIVTLAPELPDALDFIAKARRAGIIIALGHHAATCEQIEAAIAAGASLSTHLGNGSHIQLPRHPNYIWEQMAEDDLMASIIVDGHHLPPSFVKSIFRVKGSNRLILISDLVAPGGLPSGKYQLMGLDVEVVEDGSIRLFGTPYLAGSGLRLCDAIGNLIHFAGSSLYEAITMASANPARLLRVDHEHGYLRVGDPATLILLTADQSLKLGFTIIDGEICYQSCSQF